MGGIDAETLNSLAGKLDALDLTDAEREVLDRVLEHAAAYEPDVEGFAFSADAYTGLASGADLSATAFKLGSALQIVGKLPDMKMEFEARQR